MNKDTIKDLIHSKDDKAVQKPKGIRKNPNSRPIGVRKPKNTPRKSNPRP